MSKTNHHEVFKHSIFSLKPYTAQLDQKYDAGAIHGYDNNQEVGFGNIGGVIEINPSIPNLLMVADHGKGSVILYNITTGMLFVPDHL